MRETEKLAAFIRDNHPSRFCVGCLGRQLQLTVETVTLATIELALSSVYGFIDGACSRCDRRDALLGLKSPPAPEV
jgi:hypothetical protein